MNLSILEYFMLHLMMTEKDSDESFTIRCQSWKMRYFDGNGIKINLLNQDEDLFRYHCLKNRNSNYSPTFLKKHLGTIVCKNKAFQCSGWEGGNLRT